MKTSIFLSFFLFLSSQIVQAKSVELSKLDWLLGTWSCETQNKTAAKTKDKKKRAPRKSKVVYESVLQENWIIGKNIDSKGIETSTSYLGYDARTKRYQLKIFSKNYLASTGRYEKDTLSLKGKIFAESVKLDYSLKIKKLSTSSYSAVQTTYIKAGKAKNSKHVTTLNCKI